MNLLSILIAAGVGLLIGYLLMTHRCCWFGHDWWLDPGCVLNYGVPATQLIVYHTCRKCGEEQERRRK